MSVAMSRDLGCLYAVGLGLVSPVRAQLGRSVLLSQFALP